MQRDGKAPMPTFDHPELVSDFSNLSLGNQTGNPSSSTYNYNAGALPFTTPPPVVPPANYYYYPPYNGQVDEITSFELTQMIDELRSDRSGAATKRFVKCLAAYPVSLRRYACDKAGSMALQKLIREIRWSSLDTKLKLTTALAQGLPAVACSGPGRHVVKECFRELGYAENSVLSDRMIRNLMELATDEYGCICLNDCIPLMDIQSKDIALATIAVYSPSLAQDYYGTHVVQNAITRKHWFYTPHIVLRLKGDIVDLAKQKQGSHLVERCLGMPSTRRIVLEELNSLSKEGVIELACHEFGNFVIQRVFESTLVEESPDVRPLAWEFRQMLYKIREDLRWHQNGKNVHSLLKQGKRR